MVLMDGKGPPRPVSALFLNANHRPWSQKCQPAPSFALVLFCKTSCAPWYIVCLHSKPYSSLKSFSLPLLGSLKLVTPEGAPAPGLRAPEIPMTEAVEAVGRYRDGLGPGGLNSGPGSQVDTGFFFLSSYGGGPAPGLLETWGAGVGYGLRPGKSHPTPPAPSDRLKE